jgi:hypothetical protein
MSVRTGVFIGAILSILAAGLTFAALAYYFHPPVVTTIKIIQAPVAEVVYGTGVIEPERWAKVVPLQRRRLIELCRCEGQSVKAGQVLGRQDDTEEAVRYASWRSRPIKWLVICVAQNTITGVVNLPIQFHWLHPAPYHRRHRACDCRIDTPAQPSNLAASLNTKSH